MLGDCARQGVAARLLGEQAGLQVRAQDEQLTLARPPGPLGGAAALREAVPRVGKADEVRAPAGAVGGEHRADALAIAVGADDDVVGGQALEHGHARGARQTLDGQTEVVDRLAPG